MHPKLDVRRRAAAAAVAAAIIGAPGAALAADDARVADLEAKLREATELIGVLAHEVRSLQASVGAQAAMNQAAADEAYPGAYPPIYVTTASSPSADDRLREVEERLEGLEDTVMSVDERVGSRSVVRGFDAMEIDLGGFVDMAATSVIGEDNTATSFNRQVFELLIKAKLDKSWDLFIAQAFVRATGADFSNRKSPTFRDINSPVATDTVLAWANYKHSDLLNVRAGRFVTPHGIINIEHFPAILLDPEQPQFLRPFPGQTIFPNFTDGIQVHGREFVGEQGQDRFQYDLYAGQFAGNSSEWNYGGRAGYTFGGLGLTLGANAAYGHRASGSNTAYTLLGADVLVDKGPILWKSEFFTTEEQSGKDRLAFYTQPAYRINDKLTAFYRYDFLDAGQGTGDTTEHAFGLSFKPSPNVHLRSIYTHKSFDAGGGLPEADADIVQISTTYSF